MILNSAQFTTSFMQGFNSVWKHNFSMNCLCLYKIYFFDEKINVVKAVIAQITVEIFKN